jgi:hypothetical protein
MSIGGISQVIGVITNYFDKHRVFVVCRQQHSALCVQFLLINRIDLGHGAAFVGELAK